MIVSGTVTWFEVNCCVTTPYWSNPTLAAALVVGGHGEGNGVLPGRQSTEVEQTDLGGDVAFRPRTVAVQTKTPKARARNARLWSPSYGARVFRPDVTVRLMAPTERPVLERLWLMFRHDLSEFRGTLPEPDGTFRSQRLRYATDDPGWAAYLVWQQDRPVGLALVRALDQPVRVLNAFFVVRGVRRTGIGSLAVREVLLSHPGLWEVAFQSDNEAAGCFWRRIATETAGQRWTEERRAVPAQPDLPPDVWISFSTADIAP